MADAAVCGALVLRRCGSSSPCHSLVSAPAGNVAMAYDLTALCEATKAAGALPPLPLPPPPVKHTSCAGSQSTPLSCATTRPEEPDRRHRFTAPVPVHTTKHT